jgi:hypothetical protein
MTRCLFFLFFLNLSACTSISESVISGRDIGMDSSLFSRGSSSRTSRWVLSRDSQFYIARNNKLTALNSANSDALSAVIEQAISENFALSQIGLLPESFQQALEKADSLGADFLVFPSIVKWDDKVGFGTEVATKYSYDASTQISSKFGLDRALVQLMIVHASTGSVFDVIRLEASSGLLTPFGTRTINPQSILLPELQTLFAGLVAITG